MIPEDEEWDDDAYENDGLVDVCPNCGEPYDEIDHEYQICHFCNYAATNEERDEPTMESYNCGRLHDPDPDPDDDSCPMEGSTQCANCPWKPKHETDLV